LRTYLIRRKDLSHVPFQFYVYADGRERPIDKGITSTFAISPFKGQYDVVHVQIVDAFVQMLATRWDIQRPDVVRVAAKAVEAWVREEPIPADHYYGPDFLKVDADWYPAAPDGTPLIALDPYTFAVESAEAYAPLQEWPFMQQAAGGEDTGAGPVAQSETGAPREVVFGFTLDVFPGPLITGYQQFKNKIADADISARVRMLPLGELPADLDVLFVPRELADAARAAAPDSRIVVLDTFQNHPMYNSLVDEWLLRGAQSSAPAGGMQQSAHN